METQTVSLVEPGTPVFYTKTYKHSERTLVLHRRVVVGMRLPDGKYELLNPNGSLYAKVEGWKVVYY